MTAPLALDFTRVPAQSRAFKAWKPGHRICNAWGRGTGKSWFARRLMYLLVAQWDHAVRATPGGPLRGVRIYAVFPTLKHFKRLNHAQNMLDELGPGGEWAFLGAKIDRTDWTFRFPGGSFIQILTAEASNRGARADVVVLDEADEIPIAKYEAEIGPWFTQPWSLKMVLITGTPMRGRFGLLWKAFSIWPHGDAEHEPDPSHFSFHATVYDSPPELMDHAEAERARRTINPVRFDTEYLCNFDSGEGLVYPFFDVKRHVRRPPSFSEFHTFLVGVDYGFNDPTVMLVIGLAGKGADTIAHAVREEYMVGKSATEIAERAAVLHGAFPGAYWYADHEPTLSKTIKDTVKGIRLRDADKEAGSVEAGVTYVADALFVRTDKDGRTWAQLYVDPSCKHTIEEFGLYRRKRDPKNTERVLDDIDQSKNDHCMDALRYALYTHFGGKDRRLRVS